VTIGFPAQNSHGFEIMHRDAPENLARLLVAYLQRLRAAGVSGEGNAARPAQP
jgi:putative aminopeptidase FrvX